MPISAFKQPNRETAMPKIEKKRPKRRTQRTKTNETANNSMQKATRNDQFSTQNIGLWNLRNVFCRKPLRSPKPRPPRLVQVALFSHCTPRRQGIAPAMDCNATRRISKECEQRFA